MPGRDGHLPGCHLSDARAPERHHHQCHVERHFGEFPPAAAYTATKQAIEGFSASLAHEPGYFRVGVKLVEPGYAQANAIFPVSELLPGGYADFAHPIIDTFAIRPRPPRKVMLQMQSGRPFTTPKTSSASLPDRTLSRLVSRAEGDAGKCGSCWIRHAFCCPPCLSPITDLNQFLCAETELFPAKACRDK